MTVRPRGPTDLRSIRDVGFYPPHGTMLGVRSPGPNLSPRTLAPYYDPREPCYEKNR